MVYSWLTVVGFFLITSSGEIIVPNLLQLKGDEGHRKWCLVVETGQGPALGRKRA